MVPWFRCLLYKYKNLSSDLQHPRKTLRVGRPVISVFVRVFKEDAEDLWSRDRDKSASDLINKVGGMAR